VVFSRWGREEMAVPDCALLRWWCWWRQKSSSGQKATSLQAAVTSAARNCEVGTVHCERSRRMKGLDRSTRLAERLVEGIEVR
jgi:hypothetical protein